MKNIKKFKEFLNESQNETPSIGRIDESGAKLSRVLSQLDSDKDFVLISASRGEFDKKENHARNNTLLQEFRTYLGDKKIGAYKLAGHWKECSVKLKDNESIKDCKGKITNQLEESWLIVKPENISHEKFEEAAQKFAQKYEQDGYIIRINGEAYLKDKFGNVWEHFKKVNKNVLSHGFARILAKQGYTQLLRDRKHGQERYIVFEDFQLDLVIPDDTISSKQLFAYGNILF